MTCWVATHLVELQYGVERLVINPKQVQQMVAQDGVLASDQVETQRRIPLDVEDPVVDSSEREKERGEESSQTLAAGEDQDLAMKLLSHAYSSA